MLDDVHVYIYQHIAKLHCKLFTVFGSVQTAKYTVSAS